MARLSINGADREFPTLPATLAALLEALELNPATLVAEHNGVIVHRDAFADTPLAEGDAIELVTFVGGG